MLCSSTVMIHKQGSIFITTTKPPILQGCKSRGARLWTLSASEKTMKEKANNVYSLPSISQTVRYLDTGTGFPMKKTWLKTIKARNFTTWPTINSSTVRHHFPESDWMAKGHMKKQRQGVRSTRVLKDPEMILLTIPKANNIYIKVHNAAETMHTDQTGWFLATSSRGNQYIMVLVEVEGNFHRCRANEKQVRKIND